MHTYNLQTRYKRVFSDISHARSLHCTGKVRCIRVLLLHISPSMAAFFRLTSAYNKFQYGSGCFQCGPEGNIAFSVFHSAPIFGEKVKPAALKVLVSKHDHLDKQHVNYAETQQKLGAEHPLVALTRQTTLDGSYLNSCLCNHTSMQQSAQQLALHLLRLAVLA